MLLLAIRGYINLGEILWYLMYAQEGWAIRGEKQVLDYIDTIFKYLDDFNLPVTRRAGEELAGFQAKLKGTEGKNTLQVMRQLNLVI